MRDIDTAIVFTRPEDNQRLWLGFSHIERFSHVVAEAIQNSINRADEDGLTAAQIIAKAIFFLCSEVDMEDGRYGVTFDYPPNIKHSIFDFNFQDGVVRLYDSEYDEQKTSWSVNAFLGRIER